MPLRKLDAIRLTTSLSSAIGNASMGIRMSKTKVRVSDTESLRTCCFLLFIFIGSPSPSLADWREDIGYNKLVNALGDSLPNGANVPISLVEAPQGANETYFPEIANTQFGSLTDPEGEGVTFSDGSGGQSKGVSGHSTVQGITVFGNSLSVAPAANEVTVYEANDYLNDILNLNGNDIDPPVTQNFRVQNFSWIGSKAVDGQGNPDPTVAKLNLDREALRRFDYVINANNITAFVGLGNDTNSLPHFLSHSYNATAVGRSDGNHSSGLTHLSDYGVGRSKPELVSPRSTASNATSTVSSAATFLHSSDTVLGTDAEKSQTMKAVLLAGASKEVSPTWSQFDGGGVWHPLDDTYGAGELNLYNSYLVTLGGQAVGNTTTPTLAPSHGWDYQTIQPGVGNDLLYDFVIPAGSTAAELSVVLTWNAEVSAPFDTGDPVLADLALELLDSAGMTVDLVLGDGHADGRSDSAIDNVEHIYLTDLTAGTYTLKVSSDDLAADFGLAWRTSTLFDTFSADFDEDGDIDGSDFLAWQRGLGTLIGAAHASGDADGDGDVDSDDLALLSAAFSAGPTQLRQSLVAIPEPSVIALLGASMLSYTLMRRFLN